MDRASAIRSRVGIIEDLTHDASSISRWDLSSIAWAVAGIEIDEADYPLSLHDACNALRPYSYQSATTKRDARAIRKAYDARIAELETLPADDLIAIARAAVARHQPNPIAA